MILTHKLLPVHNVAVGISFNQLHVIFTCSSAHQMDQEETEKESSSTELHDCSKQSDQGYESLVHTPTTALATPVSLASAVTSFV